ncbi:MAG: hypothetical protein DDT25_00925 [Chloroflexi bacterium]|nr:hypothetical protein [Chloroflexota bacterium]
MATSSVIVQQIMKHIDQLPLDLQQRVLDFTQALVPSASQGVPGKQLAHFAGLIELDDIQAMSRAIEAGCERIDANEWIH